MGIHCAQRVVEQIDVSVTIDSPRKGYTSFLSARQVDSPFADLSLQSTGKYREIVVEVASMKSAGNDCEMERKCTYALSNLSFS